MTTPTRKQLADLIDSVALDLGKLVKSEQADEERLVKADPGEEASAEAVPEGSSTEGSPAPEAASASPEETPGEGHEGSPAPEGGEGDPAAEAAEGGAPADVETLKAEYSKLDPEGLKMHLLAAKAAYMEMMGAGDAGAPEDSAPAPAPAAPPPDMSATPGPETMKAEMPAGDGNGGEMKAGSMAKTERSEVGARLSKAESENAQLRKALDEKSDEIKRLEESVGTLATVVEATLTKPMRKAVTDISYVSKPGEGAHEQAPETVDVSKLSKSDVTRKLQEVARTSALNKNERVLINKYCIGEIGVSEIAHLFAK